MRIDELTGIKQYKSTVAPSDLVTFMKRMRFEKIGEGNFSRVFQSIKNNDLVIKIFNDPCFDRYIKFCKKNSQNPFLPRFHGNSVYLTRPPAPADIKMIRMEKLTPMNEEEFYDHSGIPMLVGIAKNGRYKEKEMWEIPTELQPLLDTIRQIVGNSFGCRIDIHHENVMLRGNQIVITDPFADDSTLSWDQLN